MADVTKVVETVFKTVDRATPGMSTIASTAQRVGGALSGLMSPIAGVVAGVASLAAMHGMVQLHSEVEDTRIALGGMFATLGQASSFTAGLQMASDVMERITVDAAKLPGEAEDYIAVFRAGLPGIQGAIGGTTTEMAGFSNQFAAVMNMLQVSTPHAAAGLQRMLSQGASSVNDMNPAFRALLPFMTQATAHGEHQIHSAKDFKNLTQQQRGEILQMTLAQAGLRDMIGAASSTWGAQEGTIKSITRMMLRQATVPLFEAAKQGLGFVNGLLMDESGHLTAMAQQIVGVGNSISQHIVGGVQAAIEYTRGLTFMFQTFGARIQAAPWFRALQNVGGQTIEIVQRVAQSPHAQAGVAGLAARAVMGPAAAVVGPLLSFAKHTEAVGQVLADLVNMGGVLLSGFEPLMSTVGIVNDLLGSVLAAVLPPVSGALLSVFEALMPFYQGVVSLAGAIATQLQPFLLNLATAVGTLVTGIGAVLTPVVRIVSTILLELYTQVAGALVPVIGWVTDKFSLLITAIGQFLSWLGTQLNTVANRVAAPAGVGAGAATGAAGGALAGIRQAIENGNSQAQARGSAEATARRATQRGAPGARGGGRTVQDFRNSRFDITQKFAEGYDPDRIAVLFAQDLGRIGERRLQSGLEPLFGV